MILVEIYCREETGIGGDGSIGVLCVADQKSNSRYHKSAFEGESSRQFRHLKDSTCVLLQDLEKIGPANAYCSAKL